MDELADSRGVLHDPAALRGQLAHAGYLFFRDLLPRARYGLRGRAAALDRQWPPLQMIQLWAASESAASRVRLMSMSRVRVLRAGSLPVVDDLTYPERGATAGSLPEGYHHLERQVRLGAGREVFERAAAALMSWRVHRAAGLKVTADGDARPGLHVVSRLAPGITAPCRVVYVIDEPGSRGFAYGTLRGHPESGEESFVVTMDQEGQVLFTVRAFARPGTLLARAAGPAGRVAQRLVAERYVRAMRRLAAG